MKRYPALLVLVATFVSVSGEEFTTKWDVEIPGPIADGTPAAPAPKPELIDFKVLRSRTSRMDVTEAPEMPDLPPITGTINVTVQVVEDPNLPDPLPPLPSLPPDDPAVDDLCARAGLTIDRARLHVRPRRLRHRARRRGGAGGA